MAPNIYTQHTEVPPVTSPLLHQLWKRWVQLNTARTACDQVRAWAHSHACLEELHSPGDVFDQIRRSNPQVKDQILTVLLQLARGGDQLAGEILLHTMLPVLTEMPATFRSWDGERDYEQKLARVIAEFWEVVATSGRTIPHAGIAGSLRLDTLHRITYRRRRRIDLWEEVDRVSLDDRDEQPHRSPDEQEQAPATVDSELASLLLWMRETGQFSEDEARFMGEIYLVHGGDQKSAAARLGISHAAARQRVSRLRTRLCAAVAEANTRDEDLAIAS